MSKHAAAGQVQLSQVRSRLNLEGPIVLRGFFRLGYCPISLDEEIGGVSCPSCTSDSRLTPKAKAYDILQALVHERFPEPSVARSRFGLVLIHSSSHKDIRRYPLVIGRDKARLFQTRLSEWFDDLRLELPKRNRDSSIDCE